MGAPPPTMQELRKAEPATAVEMWKRRVAATPDRVASGTTPAGDGSIDLEGRPAPREIAAGLVAGHVPGDRVCSRPDLHGMVL